MRFWSKKEPKLLAFKGLILGIFLFGGIVAPPLQFIKQSGIVFGTYDTDRRTLTLRGGTGELWLCVATPAGKTCKSGEDVLNWITRNGDEK
jgi:hypothetical protein